MGRIPSQNYSMVIFKQSHGDQMKTYFGLFVGILGLCFIPVAVIFVAFRSACSFVSRVAMEGLTDET